MPLRESLWGSDDKALVPSFTQAEILSDILKKFEIMSEKFAAVMIFWYRWYRNVAMYKITHIFYTFGKQEWKLIWGI